MNEVKVFLDGLNFWTGLLYTILLLIGIGLASYWVRWFFGTVHLHEDMQKILDELKKLREEIKK